MKISLLKSIVLGSAAVIATSTAWAAVWSTSFKIDFMDTDDGNGYIVIPEGGLPNNSTNDPANCVSGTAPITKYYPVSAWETAEARELVTKTLLSANLAGRSVKLNISSQSSNCRNGFPAYGNVAIYP